MKYLVEFKKLTILEQKLYVRKNIKITAQSPHENILLRKYY